MAENTRSFRKIVNPMRRHDSRQTMDCSSLEVSSQLMLHCHIDYTCRLIGVRRAAIRSVRAVRDGVEFGLVLILQFPRNHQSRWSSSSGLPE